MSLRAKRSNPIVLVTSSPLSRDCFVASLLAMTAVLIRRVRPSRRRPVRLWHRYRHRYRYWAGSLVLVTSSPLSRDCFVASLLAMTAVLIRRVRPSRGRPVRLRRRYRYRYRAGSLVLVTFSPRSRDCFVASLLVMTAVLIRRVRPSRERPVRLRRRCWAG